MLGYTDFFVVCSGNTDRQTKAIHDGIHQGSRRTTGCCPRRVEGLGEARWILMDYLDVIVHVFTPEAREFYRLEQLWGEAPRRAPWRASAETRRAATRAALRSGARGARTPDLVTASHALSQLSYSPERGTAHAQCTIEFLVGFIAGAQPSDADGSAARCSAIGTK